MIERKKEIKEKQSIEEEKRKKEELRAIVGRMKKKKTAVKDGIPNEAWINGGEKLLDRERTCRPNPVLLPLDTTASLLIN